jgi:hypothetical protein
MRHFSWRTCRVRPARARMNGKFCLSDHSAVFMSVFREKWYAEHRMVACPKTSKNISDGPSPSIIHLLRGTIRPSVNASYLEPPVKLPPMLAAVIWPFGAASSALAACRNAPKNGVNFDGCDMSQSNLSTAKIHASILSRATWVDGRKCAIGSIGVCN